MERPDLGISPLLNQSRSDTINFWRDGSSQAKQDWLASWRGLSTWSLSTVWLAGLCYSLSLVDSMSKSYGFGSDFSACLPDGRFSTDPATFRYWSSSGIFQVSLGFGHLTFTQAKAIDIIWDVIVGRGGQALLALISWRVFAKYVTTSMETGPITFSTYRSIFLQNESALLLAIPRMIRDFALRHRLQSKIAMVFMVMTMAFILAFPTWASALTGYSGNQRAHVDVDNNLVPFQSLNFVYFIIHDGWRINRGGNFIVTSNVPQDYEPIDTLGWDPERAFGADCSLTTCNVLYNVTTYVATYGFNGRNVTNSTFMGTPLGPPALNISGIYVMWDLTRTAQLAMNFNFDRSAPLDVLWAYQNTTYTKEEIKGKGRCQPLLDYQWGFSFIQLFLMLVVLIVWSCGIYTMWLYSHITMKKRGRTNVAEDYQALFELTDAIQNQLLDHKKEEAEDIRALPNSDLRRRIMQDLRGGSIAYDFSRLSQISLRAFFKSWIIQEKWWLFGFCMSLIAMGLNIGYIDHTPVIFFVAFPVELFVVMYTGTTNKSRWILFFWAFIILGVVPQIVLAIIRGVSGVI